MYIKSVLKYVNGKESIIPMHLALLVTNTDESEFAHRHPKDGQKFPTMMARVRPCWTFDVFSAKDGQFPEPLTVYDGVMITGSPASVHDKEPWIAQLLELIRDIHLIGLPLFGACFGHQAIALALGGTVERNPSGYQHGRIENQITGRQPWMTAVPDRFSLYGSHIEQVTALPDQASAVARSTDCSIAGFVVGSHVYTTQHHPEMTPDFIAALTDDMAEYLGSTVADAARLSLKQATDSDAFAESIAQFFEHGTSATA